MPVAVSYPGVYIQELPSGVRTITGVATSITAFVGRTLWGPLQATVINSFADFERQFGGLAVDMPMPYTVQDFYLNGGTQSVIVRLFKPSAGTGVAKNADTGLSLEASSPGDWANNTLTVTLDTNVAADLPLPPGLTTADLFNLTVRYTSATGGITTETIRNLSVKEGPRRVDRTLVAESQYIRYDSFDPNHLPTPKVAGPAAFTGGSPSAALAAADVKGDPAAKTGIYALADVDLFNLLCIPPDVRGGDTDPTVYQAAMSYCVDRRAMLIVDAPEGWSSANAAAAGLNALGLTGTAARNAALYFPRIKEPDPLRGGQLDTFVPCGAIAGIMATTDGQRGVWKAPAGVDAAFTGVQALSVNLDDNANGQLNPLGINCLRNFPIYGRIAWGARTLRGADALGDEYKYIPVRRLALYIEETLYRGTQWVVFEPNDTPLWAQIRLNVGAFMQTLFRQGAFQGSTPQQAYFVLCDATTNPQATINLGIVNIVVGFAPLKPAEFVVITIQQIAGQLGT